MTITLNSQSDKLLSSISSEFFSFSLNVFLCLFILFDFLCLFLWIKQNRYLRSVQFNSVTQSCPILHDPMNHSTPGLPVHHQLLEVTQTHVHWVGDAIQPSHSLSSPSPPALNLSQHQGLFTWVSFSYQVAKYWSFSFSISPSNEHPGLIFRWTGCISLQSKGLSRVFSNTTVQKHQFFGAQLSL